MIRLNSLFLAFLLMLTSACGSDSPVLREHGVGPIPQAATADKWLVVNYWAEWCKPCLEEIPELNTLQQQYPERVLVMAVNFDGLQSDALTAAVTSFDIRYTVLDQDPHRALRFDRPQQLPTTILIDPERRQLLVRVGPQTAAQLARLMALSNAGHSPR